MTRSLERLSRPPADTDVVPATFSGFSFSLSGRGESRMGTKGRKEKSRTKENDGMRRPRHVFAGACRNFPFRKRTDAVYSTSEGWRAIVAMSRLSCAHEALTPGIYSPKWKHTRVCAKHRRVAFTRRSGAIRGGPDVTKRIHAYFHR